MPSDCLYVGHNNQDIDPARNLLTALVVERKNELWSGLFFLFLFSVAKLTIRESERMVNRTEKNVP